MTMTLFDIYANVDDVNDDADEDNNDDDDNRDGY